MASKNSYLTDQLYDKVAKALSTKDNLTLYKNNIDKYLSLNTDKYFIIGPGDRPIFNNEHMHQYITLVGLDEDLIRQKIKDSSIIKSNWYIMNDPFNVANALATRYFAIKKDKQYQQLSQWYLLVSIYPSIHFKYFKYGVNTQCMDYTINNLSDKYRIKQLKSLWTTLTEMIATAYALHEDKVIKGEDKAFVDYVQDVHTRMNSLIKNIATEYYKNYENQKFLEREYESFDEDSYHEAESSSYDIQNITDTVVNHLVVHGPDMRLVEIAAKTNNVSVNELRNYTQTMINGKHRDDIHDIIEAILFLYLFNDDGESHSPSQIGTNDFMTYCLKIYKRSNTTNKNIIKIKDILDSWLDVVGLKQKTNRTATLLNFKKALYTFFVMSIQKYGR